MEILRGVVFIILSLTLQISVYSQATNKENSLIEKMIHREIKEYVKEHLKNSSCYLFHKSIEWNQSNFHKPSDTVNIDIAVKELSERFYIIDDLNQYLEKSVIDELTVEYKKINTSHYEWDIPKTSKVKLSYNRTEEGPVFYYSLPLITKDEKYMMLHRVIKNAPLKVRPEGESVINLYKRKKGIFRKWELIQQIYFYQW